jgi:subtilase family serine protease
VIVVRGIYLPLVVRNYKPYVPPANGPDLVITGISVTPSAPAAGQSATVRVTVRNQGNRAASTWFFVHLYTDRAPGGRSDVDGKWAYGPSSLAVGASAQVSIDTSFTAGAHTLYAQADTYWGYGSPDYGNVQETNENNNVFGPFALNVSGVAVDVEQTLPPSPVGPPPEPTREP